MMIDTVDKKISLKFTFQDNPGHLLKIGEIPGHFRTFQDKKQIPGLSRIFQDCGHPVYSYTLLVPVNQRVLKKPSKDGNIAYLERVCFTDSSIVCNRTSCAQVARKSLWR